MLHRAWAIETLDNYGVHVGASTPFTCTSSSSFPTISDQLQVSFDTLHKAAASMETYHAALVRRLRGAMAVNPTKASLRMNIVTDTHNVD